MWTMFRFLMVLAALTGTQARAADLCPGGQLAVMRVSKILPQGSMAGFREAARDHANWYRAKGLPVTQFVAPVMIYSPKAKAQVASEREVMTVRLGSADAPRGKTDAGWAAFVAKYKANATIVRETRTCFPKGI
jgi:hypothetical protein